MVGERAEGALAAVVPEQVRPEIVSLEQIEVAIAIEVEELRNVRVAGPGDPSNVRFFRESKTAVIDEQKVVVPIGCVNPIEACRIPRPVVLIAPDE